MGLPVITVVSDLNGVQRGPSRELRFGAGFTVALVTGDGPERTVVTSNPIPGTTPQTLVPQASVLAAGPATVRFVIAAARAVAIPVDRIQIIPHATTAQDPSNYARCALDEYDSSGVRDHGLFDGYIDTNSVAFTSMSTSIVVGLTGYTLPLGSTIVATWTKVGSGADVLGATWIIS